MADNVTANSGSGGPVFATDEGSGSIHFPIAVPYARASEGLNGSGNATGTSDTAIIAAQGSGVQICVTSLMIYNASATDTYVNIKDGSTTKLVIPAPQKGGAIITLPMPLVLTANTALNFASGTSVTTMYVSAVGFKWTPA
jgi:hypothetical protein